MVPDFLNSEELLSAYLDGELSAAETAALERQLEESLELREQLAALREVSLQVRMVPRPYAPRELRGAILDRLDSTSVKGPEAATSSRRRRIAAWSSVAVAACLLVIGGWALRAPRIASDGIAFNRGETEYQLAATSTPAAAALPQMKSAGSDSVAPSLALPKMHAAQPLAGAVEPQHPVQVITVSKDEIRRRIDDLERKPVQGNIIQVPASLKDEAGETPIVVEFTVVDVIEAMNQMQVLVQRQQVRSRDNRELPLRLQQKENSGLTAVTMELEMDGREMAEVLNSVAAFDAVMYVEQNAELAAPAGTSTPAQLSASAATEAMERTVVQQQPQLPKQQNGAESAEAGQVQDKRMSARAAQQRFDFGQLAEPTTAADAAGENGARAAAPAVASSAGEARGLQDSPPGSAANSPAAAPSRPLESSRRMSGERLVQGGEKSKIETADADRADWEEARRFRAFILLKQQAPAAAPVHK